MPNIILLLMIILTLSAADEDDVKCLRGVKNSLEDPQSKLISWNFTKSSDLGFICKFEGASCWNNKENRLLSLKLTDFHLSGNIPNSLQFCSSIQTLDLSGNHFFGSIPTQICSMLPFLVTLDLSNNLLSGEIPTDLANCNYLNKLVLSNNSFSGIIPPQLSNLKRITVFSVAENELHGPIPAIFAQFDKSDFGGNNGLWSTSCQMRCIE
ncbi:hypothetical protein RND81_01G124500 [Saponaria officinalis]|uniref:Leucine-rich repeat-containing N-terminal plant-type domain-containing protein n=1 Tax=Saponaria officinalis TaxID=3572 RepID=A0AAW1N707_SAPOF